MKETEKQIELRALQVLNLQSEVFCWKNESTGIYDPSKRVFRRNNNPFKIKGVPDILGWWRNIFFGIEMKTPENKNGATPEQRAWLTKANRAGHYATVCISDEECLSFLSRMKSGDRKDPNADRYQIR